MSMDIRSLHPPLPVELLVWFLLTWPFVAGALLRYRARSSAPLLAMLVPVAAGTASAYAILRLTLEGLARSGAGVSSASWGVSLAMGAIRGGAWFAIPVAIVALIRRHRLAIDRMLVLVAAMLTIEIAVAIGIGANIATGHWQFYACITGTAVSLLTAGAAIVRIILLRAPSIPSPAAATR